MKCLVKEFQLSFDSYQIISFYSLLWRKNWHIGTDPDAGKDWRQENVMTEDEMVRWHHWLYGHEVEQAPSVGDGQERLACCSPLGSKGLDTAEWLHWTET